MNRPTNVVLSASRVTGDKVRNLRGEELGKIEEVMIDLDHGRVAYAVLSFGGFLGVGGKLFAIPWDALEVDLQEHEFVLDVDKERLDSAPGFDKNHWPQMADRQWATAIHQCYGRRPYWDEQRGS